MDKWFILTRNQNGDPYFYKGHSPTTVEWTTDLARAKFYGNRLTVHRICMRWENNNDSFKANAKYDEYTTFTEDIV